MEECDTQLAVCHCVTVEGEQAVCHSLGPAERSQIHHICQSWVEPQISELESGRVICLCLFTHQPFLQCLMELIDLNDFMCFTFVGLLFGFVSSGFSLVLIGSSRFLLIRVSIALPLGGS